MSEKKKTEAINKSNGKTGYGDYLSVCSSISSCGNSVDWQKRLKEGVYF